MFSVSSYSHFLRMALYDTFCKSHCIVILTWLCLQGFHVIQQPLPFQAYPFYGHEENAKLRSRLATRSFACPTSTAVPPPPSTPLANFKAHTLHRTQPRIPVAFAALYLLQRLKARFFTARDCSGYRLFISAFMISGKAICDDTYSNKSWYHRPRHICAA